MAEEKVSGAKGGTQKRVAKKVVSKGKVEKDYRAKVGTVIRKLAKQIGESKGGSAQPGAGLKVFSPGAQRALARIQNKNPGLFSEAGLESFVSDAVKRTKTPARRGSSLLESSKAFAVSMSEDLKRKVLESEQLSNLVEQITKEVTFQVSPKTLGGVVLKQMRGRWSELPLDELRVNPDAVDKAVSALEKLGITVLRRGRFGITCRGPVGLVSEIVGSGFHLLANLRHSQVRSLPGMMEAAAIPSPVELSVVPEHSVSMTPNISPAIDSIAFYPAPIYFHSIPKPASVEPVPNWHHLDGARLRRLLQVPSGAGSMTGNGISLAMIDTGFYPHPFYDNYDYQTLDVPGGRPSSIDTHGHGTAMAWNVFQVAPRTSLFGIAHSGVPDDAFEIASDAGADIISCSWGWDNENTFGNLELTIRDLIQEGRTIVCASGNGHYSWPGSLPEVVSVGGVFADPQDRLEASNYASGYLSSRYPGRQVPDVCGLVGQLPKAIYLMLPCPPGADMDTGNAGAPFPQFDETASDDGWVGASGTSAATPQVAGVIALLLECARQKGRVLAPADIKQILVDSAEGVSAGFNAQGFPATAAKPNGAVGHGLVNVAKALALV